MAILVTLRQAGWRYDPGHVRPLFVLALVPTALTLAWEWSAGEAPSNVVRALAGLPIGMVVSWIVMQTASRTAVEVN